MPIFIIKDIPKCIIEILPKQEMQQAHEFLYSIKLYKNYFEKYFTIEGSTIIMK